MSDLDREVETALGALGYSRRWLDGGLLSKEELLEQYRQFRMPNGDRNLEHYRHRAVTNYLDRLEGMTDEEVDELLEIGRLDPDYSIQSDVPHSLVRKRWLTDEQLDRVASRFSSPSFDRLVSRIRLLRRLAGPEVEASVLDEAIACGDAHVHEAVLAHPRLARQQVLRLGQTGANRAIRNSARQLLESRRFRS